MARSIIRNWVPIHSVNFGGGYLMMVAWRKSSNGQLKYAALVHQEEDSGGIPSFPKMVFGGEPASWKAVRQAFRLIAGLSEDTQRMLSWNLRPFHSLEGLEGQIRTAHVEAIER